MNQPWKLYKVNFKLVSPLHIGAGKIGNLELCRTYLPGRTIWGAWTASSTREKYGYTTDSKHYDEIGNKLNEDYRISPFFPLEDDKTKLYFPWDISIEECLYVAAQN